MRRFTLLLLTILLGSLFSTPLSHTEAHGYIVRSTPADRSVLARSPNQVQIWFSEGLEPRFSTIGVFNQSGEQIDLGDGGVDERNSAKLVVNLPANLPDGAYLVRMRPVFTSDGHAVSDTLVFWVGEQVGAVDAAGASDTAVTLEAIWRSVLTVALTVLFGVYTMYALVLRPAWGNSRYQGFNRLPKRVRQWLSGLLWSALIAAFITNIFALLQISAALFDANLATVLRDELWNITLEGTNFGDVWQLRTGLLTAILAIQIIAAQQAKNRPASTHILWLVNMGLAVLTLGTMSMISHAAGTSIWSTASVLADYLHMVAVAFWVGGVIVLAVVMRPALAPLDAIASGKALQAVIRRFSRLAVVAVSLIIVTGIYSSTVQLSAPGDVGNSTYGLTLLSKWVLMLPLLGLAFVHQMVVSPQRWQRFRQYIDTQRGFARLPQTLRLELGLALAVLLAAAWLPATPPPVPDNSRGDVALQTKTVTVEGIQVAAQISPGAIGANSFDVRITQNGQPVELVNAIIRFAVPQQGEYGQPIALDVIEPGLWASAGGDINQTGRWDGYIDLYFADRTPLRAALQWDFVAEVEDTNSRSAGIFNVLAGLGVLAVMGVWAVPLGYRLLTQLDWTPETIGLAVASSAITLAVMVGAAFFLEGSSELIEQRLNTPPDNPNPIFADEASLVRGRELYANQCWLCHGTDGRGNTPTAYNLNQPATDLTTALVARDDDSLLRILQSGIVNRHPYGNDLMTEDHWHLINFLRSLQR